MGIAIPLRPCRTLPRTAPMVQTREGGTNWRHTRTCTGAPCWAMCPPSFKLANGTAVLSTLSRLRGTVSAGGPAASVQIRDSISMGAGIRVILSPVLPFSHVPGSPYKFAAPVLLSALFPQPSQIFCSPTPDSSPMVGRVTSHISFSSLMVYYSG